MSAAEFLWNVFLCVLVTGLIALVLFIAWRAFKAERQKRAEEAIEALGFSPLPFSPVERFMGVQRAFAGKDEQALRQLLGPDLIDQILADLPEQPSQATLAGVSYVMVDRRSDVISIHFNGHDKQDDSELSETWHFIRYGGAWVVNGIDV